MSTVTVEGRTFTRDQLAELRALSVELGALNSPCRKTDLAIFNLMSGVEHRFFYDEHEPEVVPRQGGGASFLLPAYTASLDAALTLHSVHARLDPLKALERALSRVRGYPLSILSRQEHCQIVAREVTAILLTEYAQQVADRKGW